MASYSRVDRVREGSEWPAKSSRGRLLTVSEVADLLNVHANTVRRWANHGLLPCYRLGTAKGDRRFRQEDVEAFVHKDMSF